MDAATTDYRLFIGNRLVRIDTANNNRVNFDDLISEYST